MTRQTDTAEVLRLQGVLMRASMGHHSRALAELDLTPVQFHLLVFLDGRDAVPTTEVSQALAVRPNIASGVIQRLVSRGWVAREVAEHDGRVRLLSLTPAGTAIVAQAVDMAETGFVEHLSVLSDDQVGHLRGILATLVDATVAATAQAD